MQQQLNIFLEHLQKAITDEWSAYYMYSDLIQATDNPQFKKMIEHARDDEKKHYEMEQALYHQLTGTYYQNQEVTHSFPSFKEGVYMALLDELEAAETYRDMLLNAPADFCNDPLFIAMTDETEHAIRFSTIYNSI